MLGEGRLARVIACVAAFVLGIGISLFTAGPALFSDGSFGQRPPILAASVLGFLAIGVAVGMIAPGAWRPAGITLAVSALPAVLLFGRDVIGQPALLLLAMAFAIGDAAAGLFGSWAGARLRMGRG